MKIPKKAVRDRIERELTIEEKTGKCINCKKNSHFGKCENGMG